MVPIIDGKYVINYKPKNKLPIEEFLKLVNHTLSLNSTKTKPRNC